MLRHSRVAVSVTLALLFCGAATRVESVDRRGLRVQPPRQLSPRSADRLVALSPCVPPVGGFNQRTRLAAMLSVHAHAYFASGHRAPETMSHLHVQPLTEAVEVLRCDPSPGAWSRRRRAIAKLLAYGGIDSPYRALIEQNLGANVPAISTALSHKLGATCDVSDPKGVEKLLLETLADEPELMPPPSGAPATAVSPCAENWTEVESPSVEDNSASIAIHTHIAITGMSRDEIARNVDPQRWDECSKFWPTPAPESTCLATVEPARGCEVTEADTACKTPLPPGTPYGPDYLYENFVCDVSPCDCRFKNVLTVSTSLQAEAFHVEYSLPVCEPRFDTVDGAISGQIGNDHDVVAQVDQGHVDVWEQDGRTHVEAEKHVEFSNPIESGTAGAVLGFTELNEELAELACCLDGQTR